ncbi:MULTISPECIES: serine/threonine-protein kinase [Streptomyces]|uniref:serine/threonine-protein kinase n=1 Tax=Streptomyces TaxID=1883 RepID=UPI001E567247|nr:MULTISPECIES: serine/threonine-protein kinase [Streptomyces]UFQ14535.1 serine/threonine protein kinase [Streptomyces huasconensis]WCL84135.1 serine/threonine-protein kinase [Streptomyces sp. JCM 35825]
MDYGEGATVAGRYRLLGLLGRGGMGVVHEAEDTRLGRRVAVKVLTAVEGLAEDGEARDRFLREARALARIEHPAVVTLYDAGLVEGTPYLVMQVLDGLSLAELVQRIGPLPAPVVAQVALDVVRGLAAAHESGVLHRDVKPSNIGINHGGHVVLHDFGLARLAGERAITRTGELVGTPQFMAPEAIRGAAPSPAADLYGLGACMYLMLTGELPLGDATVDYGAIVDRALGDGVPRLAGRLQGPPRELLDLVDRLCAQDPADRPGPIGTTEEVLERHADGGRDTLAALLAGQVRDEAVRSLHEAAAAAEEPEYDWEEAVPHPRAELADPLHPPTLSDATRRIVLSSMTPQNALSRQREAVNLVLRGELQEAARMLAAVVPVCLSSLGPAHPTTLISQYWQAVCLARLGAGDKAVELLARVNRQVDQRRGSER